VHADLMVLGSGPGGYVAAIRAAQLGLSVAIVEERFWGGVCLNVGCIPSKALLHHAELVREFRTSREALGITVSGEVQVDYGAAFRHSRKTADSRARGVNYLMRKNGITQFEGHGTFQDARSILVQRKDGTSETVTFDSAIIAVGASVNLLPGTGLSERVVSYEEQILSDSLPASIVIAGGGAIGVEFATVMHSYGVQVTVVEFLERLVPNEDEEVSAELRKRFEREGITVLTGTRVDGIEDVPGQPVRVSVTGPEGSRVLEAERVLQAIGFRPRTTGYGLESTGVALTERGAIAVDARGRTSVPGIFAIGDVTAKLMLAHAAEAMGIVAAETIAGAETMELDFRMIPRATFSHPQLSSFGYTERQAREAGFDVRVATFPFTANGKAPAIGEPNGFVKLIADARYGEILGGHIIGPDAAELLPELTLAQKWELTATELARNVHVHPTLGEAVLDAVHGLTGHMINL